MFFIAFGIAPVTATTNVCAPIDFQIRMNTIAWVLGAIFVYHVDNIVYSMAFGLISNTIIVRDTAGVTLVVIV